MKIIKTLLRDIFLIELTVFTDPRGFFFESFNQEKFSTLVNREINFVQDNYSSSAKNVLRGLHYQIRQPQAKLVRAIQGDKIGRAHV